MTGVVQHVIDAIGPPSQANAAAARARVAPAGTPVLERLAAAIAGAQHAQPRCAKRLIVVAAGDHGCGDPGIAMRTEHPTVIAATAIADGNAVLCQLARAARETPIVLVDAGAREPTHMPAIAIRLGRGPSHDLMREPAMTIVDAALGLEAGIALSVSLCEQGPDMLAIGAIGVGAEVASAAILGALAEPPMGLGDEIAEAAGLRGRAFAGHSALEILSAFGGSETAVLAGLMLGAASVNLPVILDSYATGAAALIAAALAPPITGYLIAAHRGNFTHPAILDHLGLVPAFELGLGHGEGSGAAMVLPLIDQVAALMAGS